MPNAPRDWPKFQTETLPTGSLCCRISARSTSHPPLTRDEVAHLHHDDKHAILVQVSHASHDIAA